MKLRLDKESDALYLMLVDSEVTDSEEVSPGVVLDFDKSGQVVGVEILRISQRSPGIRLDDIQLAVG